jgi:hypothetical protein
MYLGFTCPPSRSEGPMHLGFACHPERSEGPVYFLRPVILSTAKDLCISVLHFYPERSEGPMYLGFTCPPSHSEGPMHSGFACPPSRSEGAMHLGFARPPELAEGPAEFARHGKRRITRRNVEERPFMAASIQEMRWALAPEEVDRDIGKSNHLCLPRARSTEAALSAPLSPFAQRRTYVFRFYSPSRRRSRRLTDANASHFSRNKEKWAILSLKCWQLAAILSRLSHKREP